MNDKVVKYTKRFGVKERTELQLAPLTI